MVGRLVIAGAASSSGKTTITTGLLAALTQTGLVAQGFKVGPDYIDPGYHALATGRPGRNLDPVLTSEELVAPLFQHGMFGADIGVVEGVMGVFDGRLGTSGFGSTAHVAKLISAPVVVVIDVAHTSRTAAATLMGLRQFDPELLLAGVILNRVGSPRHAAELRAAVAETGVPVLGTIPRRADMVTPSRHLGLVPAAERDESAQTLLALATQISENVDLSAVIAVAEQAPAWSVSPWVPPVSPVSTASADAPPVRIAVAGGRAFTFRYAETTELLVAAGCEVVEFDPLTDPELPPATSGLYLGGGFPEVHAAELSANVSLRADILAAIQAGLPTVAECAGQLYLAKSVDGHPMVGALDAVAEMTPKLTMGYREALSFGSLLTKPDESITGHEFHRTTTHFDTATPAWQWTGLVDGYASDTMHCGYLHVHWAGYPQLAARFAAAAARFATDHSATAGRLVAATDGLAATSPDWVAADGRSAVVQVPAGVQQPPIRSQRGPNDIGYGLASAPMAVVQPMPQAPIAHVPATQLDHHGDDDARQAPPNALNLAVNVRRRQPPDWLATQIADSVLGDYPDSRAATVAMATAHGVATNMVLPTAGAAEAFTLIARGLGSRRPAVIYPQFTEPESALTKAGISVTRIVQKPPFTEIAIPASADLVVIGNPTNPTGVLHPASSLKPLAAGRILVVDEAFMDVTDETQSLISAQMTNTIVVRSCTKMWGIAGLRAGYVVGDPALIGRLAAAQPHWSVSTPALVAIAALVGRRDADEIARIQRERQQLASSLTALGFSVIDSSASFLLVHTPWADAWNRIAAVGIIARRCDTFPGLDSSWVRISVPHPSQIDTLIAALTQARNQT